MPKAVKDLTGDQLRRIYRDYLKGVPKERLIKKYDLSEDSFWEVVGLYAKKKHPNDVGNAQDIKGPADLLVSSLDTGSKATENPLQAFNPKDLRVTREQVVEEFDYDSPQEKLRKQGGEVNDLIRSETADKREAEKEEAREVIEENAEETGAILTELAEVSTAEAEARSSQAAEAAKSTPSPEDLRRLGREAAEKQVIAEQAGEASIEQARLKHAQENRKRDEEAVAAGEKLNEKLAKEEAEARGKEQKERAADHDKLRKEAEDAARKLEEAGSSDLGRRGSEGPGSDQQPPSDKGDRGAGERPSDGQGGGVSGSERSTGGGAQEAGGPVEKANTSTTAKPNPVEPAKVEPDKLKASDKK